MRIINLVHHLNFSTTTYLETKLAAMATYHLVTSESFDSDMYVISVDILPIYVLY